MGEWGEALSTARWQARAPHRRKRTYHSIVHLPHEQDICKPGPVDGDYLHTWSFYLTSHYIWGRQKISLLRRSWEGRTLHRGVPRWRAEDGTTSRCLSRRASAQWGRWRTVTVIRVFMLSGCISVGLFSCAINTNMCYTTFGPIVMGGPPYLYKFKLIWIYNSLLQHMPNVLYTCALSNQMLAFLTNINLW
jgi:hypothetical protein